MIFKPRCPSCQEIGIENITSANSQETYKSGEPWYLVVFCRVCGHIYKVIDKDELLTSE